MGDKSFKPEYICIDCMKKYDVQHRDVLTMPVAIELTCGICGYTGVVECHHASLLEKHCPICKEMVPLDEWSFTPKFKKIRQKCDRCIKNEKYLKSDIDRRKF